MKREREQKIIAQKQYSEELEAVRALREKMKRE